MKSLELTLKDSLLIVEDYVTGNLDVYYENYRKQNPGKYLKFICAGSEFTEEIAKGLVGKKQVFVTPSIYNYVNYKNEFASCLKPLESFISAIEAKGHHWGHNPEGEYRPRICNYSSLLAYQGDCRDWERAESRTFNPEKTLIFKII